MSSRLLRLFLAGVLLTLIGLVGMAARTMLDPAASLWLFLPFYGLGLAALVVALFWWLVEMTRRRDTPPASHDSSTDPDR